MSEFRMIAIASELANKVRETKKSPGYGHPVVTAVATGHGPCRHCLRPFAVGQETRMLFTMNPFDAGLPGGHTPAGGRCLFTRLVRAVWGRADGYPQELLPFAAVLDGYDGEQMIRTRKMVTDGSQETAIEAMMADPLVRYVIVRDGQAGCFDLRVERWEGD